MKLFQNLFKPKWQNNDPAIRKQAIIALNKSENQAIFSEIVESDSNLDLRLMALKRITDLESISKIAQSNSESRVKELASKIIRQTLSGENKSELNDEQKIQKIQQINDQKLYEYIAENSTSVLLRKIAIENCTREALLGNLAISDSNSDIRMSAAEKITQKSTLERVYRETKTKDKNVSRIVKERLDQLISEAEKPARLLAAQKQICVSMESLGNKGLWQRDKLQFDNYLQQWDELANNGTLELQDRFNQAKQKFTTAYEEYLERHEERLKQEAAYLPIKTEKQTIIDQLHELISRLEKHPDFNEAELSSINQTVKQQEANWNKLATLPQDIEEEIRTQFDDAIKSIKSDVKQRLHNRELIDGLEKLQKDINHNIKQPFKLTEQLIKKFENRFNELNSNELNEEIVELKQNIKNKLGQAGAVLSEQQNRLDNLFQETDKQLSRIEEYLNAGVLKDAINLRKTVQSNIKDLQKYGVKNLHQLKNRLANTSTQINELSNWRSWANTPQKEQLIQKVEALIDNDLDPREVAYIISQARNEWKKLGPSEKDSSQILWEQFKTACDKAYEPCKVFFSEESKIQQENYTKRVEFLETLEAFLQQADWETIDWKKVETLFRHARQEWQNLGTTDKKKRTDLNKRFYASYNKLKQALNEEWDKNTTEKAAIVAEAQALAEVEDLQEAINSTKSLQQRWKKAGRIQHTKERELWTQFKQASDAVFSRREDLNKQKETEASQHVEAKNKLVTKIENYCNQSIEEIGANKAELNQLQSELREIGKTNSEADSAFEKRINAALHLYERKLESLEKHEIISDLKKLKEMSSICDLLDKAIESENTTEIDSLTKQLENFEGPGQSEWAQKMRQRFELSKELTKLEDSKAAYETAATRNLEQKSLTAVQLEIIADIDTPAEAADARLKAQAQRLSDKLQNHSEENRWDSFLSAEVSWLTTGPIFSEDWDQLNERHSNTIKALKSDYSEELKNY